MKKITVVGMGYVGLGVGVMLATKHDVTILDIDAKRVELLNEKKSPIKDEMIEEYLSKKKLRIHATTNEEDAYANAQFIIIAVPTNYDEKTDSFDTRIVEGVIRSAMSINPQACIVIKSTIPIGYTKSVIQKLHDSGTWKHWLMYSPEFLREGTALKDNLYPSRIIVGCDMEDGLDYGMARNYAKTIKECTLNDCPVVIMGSTEAESVKLFSNTYLAMRVAFFNELDIYAEKNSLNSCDIIKGVCMDPRIGEHYNNPSFGYGGYCLPKDTKQLLSNFKGVPQNLIRAIVESNETRKRHIADEIIRKAGDGTVGFYKTAMKSGSDNSRSSAIIDIIRMVLEHGITAYVYEPTITGDEFNGCKVMKDIDEFKKTSGLIVTNRYSEELDDVENKVYTRDVFNEN